MTAPLRIAPKRAFMAAHLPRLRPTPRFFLLLIFALCIFFGVSCGLSHLRSARVSRRIAALTDERDTLRMQLQALEERLSYVQGDAYVQRVARDELNMLYPEEIRYIPD